MAGPYQQMIDDIASYESDLVAVEQDLRKSFDAVHALQGAARSAKLKHISSRMYHAKQLLQTIKLELREATRESRAQWEVNVSQHTATIERYEKLLVALQNDAQRQDLLEGRVVDADALNPTQIIQHAAKVQESSVASLARSKNMVQKSHEVGVETASQLHAQTEKLKGVDTQVKDMDQYFAAAKEQIRVIGKRVETDKFIMVMLLLCMLGVIVIIAYKWFHPDSKLNVNVPKGFTPPTSYE